MSAVTPLRVSTLCDDSAASTVTVLVGGVEAPAHVQRLPRARLFALGEAPAELAEPALRRLVEHTGERAHAVAQDHADGAADRRVGAVAGPEQVAGSVHAQRVADRAVDDDHRRGAARAAHRDVHAVVRVVHRAQHRADHREVLGKATREHAVHDDRAGSDLDTAHRLAEQHVRPATTRSPR